MGFTSIPKRKLALKFTMSDIKFHRIENPYHHMRNFVSAMTLKRIDKDIFHIIFLWTFNMHVMRCYNVAKSRKVTNRDDFYKEFLQ